MRIPLRVGTLSATVTASYPGSRAALSRSRLVGVYGYVAAANPRTRFLVYSRGAFSTPEKVALFVGEAETRFPALRGRIQTLNIPGDPEKATFRDPATARLIRDRVAAILGMP